MEKVMTLSDLQSKRVLQLLSEEADDFGAQRIHPDMRLAVDLGMRGFVRIAFAFRLEQELGIHLDDSHYDAITNHTATVADVLAAVRCLTTHKETA